MGTKKVERGPVSERVADNVRALRMARRMTLDDLAGRMRDLGRPILRSGLSKIESGERRVDVDDLVGLSIALQVTPNRLLLTGSVEDERVGLTDDYSTTDRAAWLWVSASTGEVGGVENPAGRFHGQGVPVSIYEFQCENRPQRPPVLLSPADWRKLAPFEERMNQLRMEVERSGLDPQALVETVFEAHDDPEHEHKD